MSSRDTIAAVASAHGQAGIGVIRLSGPQSLAIAGQLCAGAALPPRQVLYRSFRDQAGQVIDRGLVLVFPAPASYTGEDVVELHGHGNPILLDLLLARLYQLGARPARPGEFSERAFLEGKLDLAQAEAVADLIAAGSEAAARAAQRSLDGEFSRRVQALLDGLVQARIHVEAAIDFPEEDIDFLSDGAISARLEQVASEHADLLAAAERGQRLRDGAVIAIIGRPNAGKSSLLNALAGADRAIVTEVAGTTRDVLREEIRLGPVSLTLIDTAGLRDSQDRIEQEGVRRARAELARADHALLLVDASQPTDLAALRGECPPGLARTLVFNKIDLLDEVAIAGCLAATADTASDAGGDASTVAETVLAISVHSGQGLPKLIDHLQALAGADGRFEGTFSARRRHVDALRRAGEHLHQARLRLHVDRAGELVAEELHQAQQALAQITGAYTPDDLLGAIFSSFCIGK
ncbi:MAG: tRNA uridine-5-carboxymethylaminomethyl(34) synthesis GTPase MnmE [Xanthomonadales bacterium]|nr:tRNA uridine-5-carboxymethylaminomethyl(34) synthesis GTPase MnmE [Xanthomonadales bacterium]